MRRAETTPLPVVGFQLQSLPFLPCIAVSPRHTYFFPVDGGSMFQRNAYFILDLFMYSILCSCYIYLG
jgi:hypothetical protein